MIIKEVIKTIVVTKYRELLMSWFSELFTLAGSLFKDIDQKEEPKLIQMKYFPFNGFSYMSWCGNIIYKKDRYANIKEQSLWHEKIHILQAAKSYKRWYQFYLSYLKYWIKGNPISNPSISAYYTIPYEMEAYANEDNPNYQVTKDSYKRYIIKDRKNTFRKNRSNWIKFIKQL